MLIFSAFLMGLSRSTLVPLSFLSAYNKSDDNAQMCLSDPFLFSAFLHPTPFSNKTNMTCLFSVRRDIRRSIQFFSSINVVFPFLF